MKFSLTNKSLKAALRGYVLFDVNGRRFWNYNKAIAARKVLDGDVFFAGFHIIKGWRYFFLRIR